MIILDNLPFSHVEDIGFMALMKEIIPSYNLKSRCFYTEKVDEVYMKLRENVKLEIQTFIYNGVSFTTDIWSNLTESLLSLTLHGINDDFERVQFVLHAQPLSDERHTVENLNCRFEEMLGNWKIDKAKVHMVLRDGGTNSNIIKALGLSDLQSANCSAHQINLIVQEALKAQQSIKSSLETCRKIAGHFNHSDPARKKLEEIQKRLDNNKQSLRIIQESVTRWNSCLAMVRRIHELREAITLYSVEQNLVEWSGISWSNLEKLIIASQPFEATEMVLSANKSSIADVLYIGHLLKKTFGKGFKWQRIRNWYNDRCHSKWNHQWI